MPVYNLHYKINGVGKMLLKVYILRIYFLSLSHEHTIVAQLLFTLVAPLFLVTPFLLIIVAQLNMYIMLFTFVYFE